MKILIVSDAWHPQVNGVVRTIDTTREYLEAMGHEVTMLTPDQFCTVPCPTYPEIRLAVLPGSRIGRRISELRPDAVHLSTEGPLGLAARRVCMNRGLPFTTSFHTRFPEYIERRVGVPARWTFKGMRWFHAPATRVLAATQTLCDELAARGLPHTALWPRGVDTELFRPYGGDYLGLPRPLMLYVGRVAPEKNLEAFLALDRPGSKVIVGDGPARAGLQKKFPEAVFLGPKHGEELARCYADADVFVFPSKTDTYGLVMLEALAAGVPVAAFPVPGPKDVLTDRECATLHEDLGKAVDRSLGLLPSDCRRFAMKHGWKTVAERFAEWMAPIDAAPQRLSAARARG